MSVKQIPLEDFHSEMRAQGVDRDDIAFVCPKCHCIQSVALMVHHGVSAADALGKYLGFSCIGRFTEDRGCNWTLGGLLQIHEVEVIHPGGEKQKTFRLATPEGAALLRSQVEILCERAEARKGEPGSTT